MKSKLRRQADGLATHFVTIPMWAREKDVDAVTAAIWSAKYSDFPAPVFAPSSAVRVYLREELDEWHTGQSRLSTTFGKRPGANAA